MSAVKRTSSGVHMYTSSSESETESEDEAISFKRNRKDKDDEGTIKPISPPRSNNSTSSNGKRSDRIFASTSASASSSCSRSYGVTNSRTVDAPDGEIKNRSSVQSSRQLVSYADCDSPSSTEIMKTMGFEKGRGIAKFIPSIPTKIFVAEDFEKKVNELAVEDCDVNLELDKPSYEEEVSWIPPEVPKPLDLSVFLSWRKVGPMLKSVESECTFVDSDTLHKLISCKKVFQDLEESHYQKVRARSNVFETIGKGPFICRAAMKMANLDAILGYALTEPKTQSGSHVVGHNDLFYFADVCAGPGGFTEYILWRKKWECKGFGLTLKGSLDFDIDNFVAAEPEPFEAYYGPASDGNIYKPENVLGYLNYVLTSTEGRGVHLMMADGGFSVCKQEYMQEILSGQIILSQCLVALGVVRIGGHFVCKLFDVFTPFSVGLIYLMYLCFDLVSIHKPNTSRPANSERYLICKWKREGTDTVMKYLMDCHRLFWEFTRSKNEPTETILELVSNSVITNASHPFFKYITESNNSMAQAQIRSLTRMIAYVRNAQLENPDQADAKQKCLELWNIPEKIDGTKASSTTNLAKGILAAYPHSMLKSKEMNLVPDTLESFFKSPYDWRFVVVGAEADDQNRGFYMTMGREMIFRYEGSMWVLADFADPNYESKLRLTSRTLVYGEVVEEVHGKKPSQKVVPTFHIIDALMLGGNDIRTLHYTQRHECCVKFAKAMNNNIPGRMPVRAKNPVRMENIADVIDRLEHRVIKGAGQGSKLVCPVDHTDETSAVIRPSGLLFIKITKDPWQMALNRQANRKYWYNTVTGKAKDSVPEEAIADFFWTMRNRVVWWWDRKTNVVLSSMDSSDPRIGQLSPDRVHAFSLTNHVHLSLRGPHPPPVPIPMSHPHREKAP